MRISQNIAVKAYAKVNLFLQILGKRPDGFHEIQTVFQSIDLGDNLTFETAADITLEDYGLGIQDNLVWRAAHLLKSYSQTDNGASITLRKKIPTQAGLGGGSSDAAATLWGLNKLWNLNFGKEELFKLGAQLGSDVNFFLVGGLAKASGRGEQIKKINKPLDFNLVIAKPNFGISSKEAYDLWDKKGSVQKREVNALIDKVTAGDFNPEDLFNDLESGVLDKYKQYERIYASGYEAGASRVMLSGSGSAVFAIVEPETQDKVYAAWQKENLTIYKARTIDRSFEKIES